MHRREGCYAPTRLPCAVDRRRKTRTSSQTKPHDASLYSRELELSKRQLSQVRDERVLKSRLNQLWFVPKTLHQSEISHKKAQKAQKHEEILCAFVAKYCA